MSKLEEEIVGTLGKAGKPLRPREIAELMGGNINTIRGRLFYLCREGRVRKVQKGLYKHASNN